MRPLLLLPLLLLWVGGRAAAPPDSLSQLPRPQNPRIRLYNTEQVLSWEPVSLTNDTRLVTYRVEYKFTSGDWSNVSWVNCAKITKTECDFSSGGRQQGFQRHYGVYLRVRAELGDLVSKWTMVPWFQHYRNVTIGPPKSIEVIPGEGSLNVRVSPPFEIDTSMVSFQYNVSYWEETGIPKTKDLIKSNFILLDGLKPLSVYCLQVRVELVWREQGIFRPGRFSNTTCSKTTANAAAELQQPIVIFVGLFLSLVLVAAICFFLVLKYRGVVKYWFHSPPKIPLQIEEYLKDPSHPVLETLERNSSPKDDAWDSVSIVSFPE
ncbi:interferon gamma receptor 2 [Rhynchocyon petersi]